MDIPEVKDSEVAFGPRILTLPDYDTIPDEFKNWNNKNKWGQFVTDIFFHGIKKLEMKPKEGVDVKRVHRWMMAHLHTWSCKHEHKEAGIAYQLSLWLDDIIWEKGK